MSAARIRGSRGAGDPILGAIRARLTDARAALGDDMAVIDRFLANIDAAVTDGEWGVAADNIGWLQDRARLAAVSAIEVAHEAKTLALWLDEEKHYHR